MVDGAHFEVFAAKDALGDPSGEFCWRFQGGNGRIQAVGGESFTRREDAHRAIADFLGAANIYFSEDVPVQVLDLDG